eukprot:6207018-Pleurochrysis_carterae.AAC.1
MTRFAVFATDCEQQEKENSALCHARTGKGWALTGDEGYVPYRAGTQSSTSLKTPSSKMTLRTWKQARRSGRLVVLPARSACETSAAVDAILCRQPPSHELVLCDLEGTLGLGFGGRKRVGEEEAWAWLRGWAYHRTLQASPDRESARAHAAAGPGLRDGVGLLDGERGEFIVEVEVEARGDQVGRDDRVALGQLDEAAPLRACAGAKVCACASESERASAREGGKEGRREEGREVG